MQERKFLEARLVHFIKGVVEFLAQHRISFAVVFYYLPDKPTVSSVVIKTTLPEISKLFYLPVVINPYSFLTELLEEKESMVVVEEEGVRIICYRLGIHEIAYRFCAVLDQEPALV